MGRKHSYPSRKLRKLSNNKRRLPKNVTDNTECQSKSFRTSKKTKTWALTLTSKS